MKNYSCILTMLGMYLCSVPLEAHEKGDPSLSFGMTTTNEGFATKATRLKGDPSLAVGVTEVKEDVYIQNVRSSTSRPAHRVVAGGNLLPEDSDKMKFCLRDSEIEDSRTPLKYLVREQLISFRNRTSSRSPNNPGLDLFGSFWGDAKKNIQKTITGTVRDASGVMPGVTVTIQGKKAVTLTDSEGKYTIDAETGDILVFSYVGYRQFAVAVAVSSTAVDVIMTEDATALQEVVVNAGYYTVKDSERTGSIAKITAKDIEKQPITNVLGTLQGRMAGVHVSQETGVGGGGFAIQIRGINSLRAEGNAPLYVIDGVPYSAEAIGHNNTAMVMPTLTSPLNNINPGDIESIEVLKDADATAIYGSRGANGVVLITTKRGKQGKTQFSAMVSQGTGKVSRFMKMLNTEQHLALRAEAFANDGITEYPENAYDINGTWDQNRYTDWQKAFLGGTSKITNLNASVSGGSAKTQFLLSGNFGSETTVFPGDFGYKKANLHWNANHESEDGRFRMSLTGGYTIQDNNQPSTDLTIDAWILVPNAPALYDAAGNLNWEDNTFENPLAKLNGLSLAETRDLVTSGLLSYRLTDNLEAKASMGFTALDHRESSSLPSTMYNPAYGLGSDQSTLFYSRSSRQSWIIEPQLNWKPKTGAIKTDILVGTTFQQQDNRLQATLATGFSSNSMLYNPAAAATQRVIAYDESEYRYQSVFARVNFNHDSRYILNLTGRRDGSSRFGPGNSFAWFGAVGAAWLFSNEKALKENTILSFGKLRGSYGTTGSDQIGNYQFLDTYTAATTLYQGVVGLQPTRLYNADFGWETNRKLEVALETGFLRDRIFFTAAWYRNRSSDQLVGIPLPGTAGFSTIQSNLDATVENKGVELTLRTVNLQGKDFSWVTNINLSKATNKLLSFPNLEGSTFSNRYVVGQPLNIVKTYHYTGIDAETGVYTFEDINGDGVIGVDDQTTVVDLNPQYFGGVHNEFRYKGLQLDFLFQFVKQRNFNTASMLAVPGTMSNQEVSVLDHWQAPGDNAATQVYTTGGNAVAETALYNYVASDGVLTDASFIRLKNVALSYEIPQQWLGGVRCRVQLQGQNLLTLTSFKGMDPETRAAGRLPALRILTAGLQFNF